MRKTAIFCVVLLAALIPLSAYNPSSSGELLYELGTPNLIANGGSVTGGALPSISSEHVAINPALTAGEQRVVLDASFSGLFGKEAHFGFGGNIGAVIPSKVGVFTASGYFLSSKLPGLDTGTNITLRGGFAKDVTEKLHVGADLSIAFGSAFGASVGLGFNYRIGKISWLPFLSDIRLGAAITNMGYGYAPSSSSGLYEGKTSSMPGMFTPRFGISGAFVNTDTIKAGLSLDISAPSFSNLVLDTGLQLLIADMVRIKTSNNFNLREMIAGTASYIPTVSVSVKFGINTKDDSFMAKQGWQKSELAVSAGYRYLYDDVHVVSAGAVGHLGSKDTAAPEITLW